LLAFSAVVERVTTHGQQLAQQLLWPGRGGDEGLRIGAEPQAKGQHVKALALLIPGTQLIGPRRIVLGSAQTVRLFGRVQERLRTVLPYHAPLGGLVQRAIPLWGDGDDAAFAVHHDIARVGRRRADKGDSLRAFGHLLAHPLRASAGLACPAAAQQHPETPVTRRRQLRGPGPRRPVKGEHGTLLAREAVDELLARLSGQ
jgi:hypothetical protein